MPLFLLGPPTAVLGTWGMSSSSWAGVGAFAVGAFCSRSIRSLEVTLSMAAYSPELRFRELHNLAILPLRGSWAVLMARWERPMTVSALGFLSTVSPDWAIMLVDTGGQQTAASNPSAH